MKELQDYTIRELFERVVEIIGKEDKIYMKQCHYIHNDLWPKGDPRHYDWRTDEVDWWVMRTELQELKKVLYKLRDVRFEKNG